MGQCKRCQTLPMWCRCSDPYCLFASKHTKKLVSSYRPFQQGRLPPLSSCSRGTWKGLFWAQSRRLDSSEHGYIYTWRPCHIGKLRCPLFGCAYSSINTCMHGTQEKECLSAKSVAAKSQKGWCQSNKAIDYSTRMIVVCVEPAQSYGGIFARGLSESKLCVRLERSGVQSMWLHVPMWQTKKTVFSMWWFISTHFDIAKTCCPWGLVLTWHYNLLTIYIYLYIFNYIYIFMYLLDFLGLFIYDHFFKIRVCLKTTGTPKIVILIMPSSY